MMKTSQRHNQQMVVFFPPFFAFFVFCFSLFAMQIKRFPNVTLFSASVCVCCDAVSILKCLMWVNTSEHDAAIKVSLWGCVDCCDFCRRVCAVCATRVSSIHIARFHLRFSTSLLAICWCHRSDPYFPKALNKHRRHENYTKTSITIIIIIIVFDFRAPPLLDACLSLWKRRTRRNDRHSKCFDNIQKVSRMLSHACVCVNRFCDKIKYAKQS